MKKTDHPPTGITPIKDKKSIIINDFMVCSLHKNIENQQVLEMFVKKCRT